MLRKKSLYLAVYISLGRLLNFWVLLYWYKITSKTEFTSKREATSKKRLSQKCGYVL